MAAAGTQTIATSSGQNDAGLFDVNLRDERWLPFEGQGAISTWNLMLDPRDNNFDFSTITDVVLHVRYTARGGGDQTVANNVRNALTPTTPRSILVSVRNTFGNAYYAFFNPVDPTQQTLTLPMTNALFPFSNFGKGGVIINSITFFVMLSPTASSVGISASFNPTGATPTPGSLQLSTSKPIAALTAAWAPAPAVPPPPFSVPQSFTMTVSAANVSSSGLATTVSGQTQLDPSKIEDILLIINYSIN
jgi:hypothetical protein